MQRALLFRTSDEVSNKLASLNLDQKGLAEAARRAVGAYRDSTSNDPANAAGTFSYIFGTRALRDIYLGSHWSLDRKDSVEGIRHAALDIKVVFQNVDIACDDEKQPKPRSPKGAGSERACGGNQGILIPDLPRFSPASVDGAVTYYLMVSVNGSEVRAELSRPVVKNETFSSFVERIYIVADNSLEESLVILPDEIADDNYDVEVSRK